jgi:hypothetical protein
MTNPKLAPEALWAVRFKATKTGTLWVRVRLLDAAGATCFQSATEVLATVNQSFTVNGGATWSLFSESVNYQNACGETFTIVNVDVNIMDGAPYVSSTPVLVGIQTAKTTSVTKKPTPTPTPTPASKTCNGASVPSSAACGTPTAKCNDSTWSCSQNRTGTCSSHGGVSCWVCPGPLC